MTFVVSCLGSMEPLGKPCSAPLTFSEDRKATSVAAAHCHETNHRVRIEPTE